MLTRRRFLGYSALSSAALAGRPLLRNAFGQAVNAKPPLRLCIIGSRYTLGSDLQSIADRFLVGYPFEGDWHQPNVQVVSVYVDSREPKFAGPMRFETPGSNEIARRAIEALVRANGEPASDQPALADQAGRKGGRVALAPSPMAPLPPVGQSVHGGRPQEPAYAGDLSAERARAFGFRLCRNIPEALHVGGDRLAVDAVLCVVEQDGTYPTNNLGQTLLPQFDFFQQCAQVFQEEGRGVPYFNYRQLGFGFSQAQQMVQTAQKLKFPLLAGSALPVTFRLPAIDIPLGASVPETVIVGIGAPGIGDFDALDALQSMVERRQGGETGIKAVQVLEGDDVWAAGDSGRYSKELLSSALSRSDTPLGLTLIDGRTQDLVASGALPQLVSDPLAYCIEYNDGTKATLLMLNGAVLDFNISARTPGKGENGLTSCQLFRPPSPNLDATACLAANLEQFFLTGQAPHPIQRNLLTTGLLDASFQSRHRLNQRIATPQLAIRYQPPSKSQFITT